MTSRASGRLQATTDEGGGEQEAWRRAQKEDAELYRRYLLAHASALGHLSWLLHSHASQEERGEYMQRNKLRAASCCPVERARLSEQMDASIQLLRIRSDIADALGSGAIANAEHLALRLAVWRGRRDAAARSLFQLNLPDAAFGLDANGDTLTLTFWRQQSVHTTEAARQFAKSWHAELREHGLGRSQVVTRYSEGTLVQAHSVS